MKSLLSFTMSALLTLVTVVASYASVADGYCSFYYDKNYRGKVEKCESGDHYPGKWGWSPRSLKLGDGCKAVFYYTDRFNKKKKYTFSSSEKDLYRKMAQWRLRSNKYWSYIDKVVIICGGGDNYAGNQGNHGNNSGNMGNWRDQYNKGYLICWRGGNYGNEWYAQKLGKYEVNRLKFKPYSLRCPKNYEVVYHYVNRNGQNRTHEFRGDVKDLKAFFKKWNLRNWQKPYDYIKYVEFRKYNGGGQMADRGGNNDRGGNMGGWKQHYDKGFIIFYGRQGYQDDWKYYKAGKYDISRLGLKPYSLRIPNGYICKFYYKDRSNRTKYHEFKGSVSDLTSYFKKWNLRDWRKPYQYITHVEYVKYGGGNGVANNDRGGNMGGWKQHYDKGFIIFYGRQGYQDNWKYYKAGKYDISRLGLKPYSLRIPNGYICKFYYKDRSNRTKYHEFKGSVSDLTSYFKKWNLRDWKKPYNYITSIEYVKYGGGNGNANGNMDRQRGGALAKNGYVVFYKYAKFDGEKYDKAQGSYDYKRLKFIPGSFVLSSSRYIVLEYQDARKRIRSKTFKYNIKDLEYELRNLGVYDKKYPLRSVRRIAVMVE